MAWGLFKRVEEIGDEEFDKTGGESGAVLGDKKKAELKLVGKTADDSDLDESFEINKKIIDINPDDAAVRQLDEAFARYKKSEEKGAAEEQKDSAAPEKFEGPEYDRVKKDYDQIEQFIKEKGLDSEKYDFEYRLIKGSPIPGQPERLAGEWKTFKNYHDLSKYIDSLTPEERDDIFALDWKYKPDKGRKKKIKGVAVFGGLLESLSDKKSELYQYKPKLDPIISQNCALKAKDLYTEAVERGIIKEIKPADASGSEERNHESGASSSETFNKIAKAEQESKWPPELRDALLVKANEFRDHFLTQAPTEIADWSEYEESEQRDQIKIETKKYLRKVLKDELLTAGLIEEKDISAIANNLWEEMGQ